MNDTTDFGLQCHKSTEQSSRTRFTVDNQKKIKINNNPAFRVSEYDRNANYRRIRKDPAVYKFGAAKPVHVFLDDNGAEKVGNVH